MWVEDNHAEVFLFDEGLTGGPFKNRGERRFRNGQIEDSPRLCLPENMAVEQVLPESPLQFRYVRRTGEALDLYGDFRAIPLGGDHLLSPQVDLEISDTPRDGQRIVRDCPAVFDECVLYGVVKQVPRWHNCPLRTVRCILINSIRNSARIAQRSQGTPAKAAKRYTPFLLPNGSTRAIDDAGSQQ